MNSIKEISEELNQLEILVNKGSDSCIKRMGHCLERILKTVIEECHTKLKGTFKRDLMREENEISSSKTYHNFTLGELITLWDKFDMPYKLCSTDLRNINPRDKNRFQLPFYDFLKTRNINIHLEEQQLDETTLKLYFFQLKNF